MRVTSISSDYRDTPSSLQIVQLQGLESVNEVYPIRSWRNFLRRKACAARFNVLTRRPSCPLWQIEIIRNFLAFIILLWHGMTYLRKLTLAFINTISTLFCYLFSEKYVLLLKYRYFKVRLWIKFKWKISLGKNIPIHL